MPSALARLISRLLHPAILPTLFLLIFFQINPLAAGKLSLQGKLFIMSILFVFTFLLPVVFVLILIKAGFVQSLEMESKEERKLPFLATAICFITGYYLLKEFRLSEGFNLLMLGATLSTVLASLVNYFRKISLHMIGIGGVCGALLGLSRHTLLDLSAPIIISFLLAGVISWARLTLKAHSQAQIYAGFLLGFLCEFVLLRLW